MSTASAPTAPSQAQTVAHWLDGQRVTTDARTIEITNPADGTIIGSLPCADEALVDRAVRSSAEAFKTWSATGLSRTDADHAALPDVCSRITRMISPT